MWVNLELICERHASQFNTTTFDINFLSSLLLNTMLDRWGRGGFFVFWNIFQAPILIWQCPIMWYSVLEHFSLYARLRPLTVVWSVKAPVKILFYILNKYHICRLLLIVIRLTNKRLRIFSGYFWYFCFDTFLSTRSYFIRVYTMIY